MFLGGGGGGGVVSSIFDLTFLGDGLILDGNCQRAFKSKPFRRINSRITKSSRILEYF